MLLAGAALIALATPALAQAPEGGAVAHGSATISASAAETRVHQTTNRAIIDWRSFDVGRDHGVAFDQPSAQAATLNRVNSGRESTIAGRITAPGTVIIQNNHGVVFSDSARVDVGSLVATSRTVDAQRFAADGRLKMRGGEVAGARVENQGAITVREAGLAALVGGRVANSGTIVARRGTVALASGETTTIDLAGDGVAKIAVTGDTGRADAGVENTGLIDAGGGRVLLSAGSAAGLLANVINTSGVIRAASVDGAGGTIELVGRGEGTVRVAGTLDASGATRGGAVTVTGQSVQVAGGARVHASGRAAGGSVRIGGDRQGQGELRRAETVRVDQGARIEARSEGTGGSVILWADQDTWFAGSIAADGPRAGGFVETSAKEHLGIAPSAEVTPGAGGLWLLDPRNVTIVAPPDGDGVEPGINNPPDAPGTWTVNRDVIQNVLGTAPGTGSDVTITTVQPAGTDAGDIRVDASITWNGAGSLTLTAGNDIGVDAAITSSGAGNLTLTAGNDIGVDAAITSSGAGNVTLTAGNDIGVDAAITSSGAGNLTLTAGNDIGVDAAITSTGAGSLTLTAGRYIEVDPGAAITSSGAGNLTLTAGRYIEVDPGAAITSSGAALTMRAPVQTWNGRVEAGTAAAPTGGTVVLAGDITAAVAPIFNLGPDRHFTLEASAPGGTASRYTSTTVPLRVDTRGAGAITLNAPVTAAGVTLVSEERVTLAPGATVTATGTGDALVIAAGRGFANQAGPGALITTAPTGRWLVFLDSFAGMLGAPATPEFDLYHRQFNYATPERFNIPGQIAALGVLAGNRIVYGEQPVITVTAESLAKIYGMAIGAIGASVAPAGLRPKDAPLATILVGGTTATSAGAPAVAPAGTYAIDPVASLTAQAVQQRYRLVLVPGTLTVNPAPLTVTANDAARLYGAANPAFDASFAGFVLGQDRSVLVGTLGFTTDAAPASPVGAYTVTPGGLTSGNYAISFVPGTLTVNPAPLTVTANDAARLYGAANPAFTARYGGFVLGQGPGVLGGALAFATPATEASPAGHYAIVPSGLTSGNYAITFVPGTLTVLAPVTLPPLELRPLTVNGVRAVHPGDAGLRIAVFEPAMPAADLIRLDNELDNERERE